MIYADDVASTFAPFLKAKAKKQAQQLAAAKAQNGGQAPGSVDGAGPSDEKKSTEEKDPNLGPGQRYLLHDFNGVIHPGEMLLVVVSVEGMAVLAKEDFDCRP